MKKLLITILIAVAATSGHAQDADNPNPVVEAWRAKVEKWAENDATTAWPKLMLLPGKDGKFNEWEVAGRAGEAAESMARRHQMTRERNPQLLEVYEETFVATIALITQNIQDKTNAIAQPWKHLDE
jgi:hypothetical protein